MKNVGKTMVYRFSRRRRILYLILLFIVLTLTIMREILIIALPFIYPKYTYIPIGNITCHFQTNSNTLNSTDLLKTIPRDGSSIFFHETSCLRKQVRPRNACAVESAARMNPERNVFLIFSAPIEENYTQEGLLAILQQYKNVKLARIEFNEYIKDTPLSDWTNGGMIMKSGYRMMHASDVLRMLTLWKFGGIYLDSDFVVVKNLNDLFNRSWAARESHDSVASGAIRFGFDGAGRDIIEEILKELKHNFNTSGVWAANGPLLLTKVLQKYCTTQNVTEMNQETCHGFEVFDSIYFYPISSDNRIDPFQPMKMDEFRKIIQPYMFHMWNHSTKNVLVEDKAPYGYLAEEYCPRVYEVTKTYF